MATAIREKFGRLMVGLTEPLVSTPRSDDFHAVYSDRRKRH